MDSSLLPISFRGVKTELTRVKNKPILYENIERAFFHCILSHTSLNGGVGTSGY